MCSIFVTNRKLKDLSQINAPLQSRGPDFTNITKIGDFQIIHNLLSLTGRFSIQPLIDSTGDIICLFNGEIYNHADFGSYETDGACIIPAYEKYGPKFAQYLDGEFAIILIDVKSRRLLFATDPFGTKPLWIACENGDIGLATYKSALTAAGFRGVSQVDVNSITSVDLASYTTVDRKPSYEFALKQFKMDSGDWITAFKEAVHKRAFQSKDKLIFMGLSSGYDSGAIANELTIQNADFKAFSISGPENARILKERHTLLKQGKIIPLSKMDFERLTKQIELKCEGYTQKYKKRGQYNVKNDQASVGLARICEFAVSERRRIYLSGHGADEIISDYGFAGQRFSGHSEFGGVFPDNLRSIFPWRNFFGGTMRMYLAKEEHVAGMFGIEARYPFLDKKVVQEFLHLSPQIKNKSYKSPIREYLIACHYPFLENTKVGFEAGQNLI